MYCVCNVESNLVFAFVGLKSQVQVCPGRGQFLWVDDSTVATNERRTGKRSIKHLQVIVLTGAILLQEEGLRANYNPCYSFETRWNFVKWINYIWENNY